MRYIGYTIYCANSEKGTRISLQEYWPMFKDKQNQQKAIASWAETPVEMRDKILKIHGLKK